ncbi:MAG: H-NS family nucleoid-associated regulatory protein [Thiolinea sp.]
MTNINLDALSIEDLSKLQKNIDSTIANKRQSDLVDIRQQLDELIDNSQFTLQEVLEAKPPRKPVKPKYKNPQDETQTWTGRGRRPRWVDDCLNNGMELTDLLI